MPRSFTAKWLQTPRLNGVGQLLRATRMLQRALAHLPVPPAAPPAATSSGPATPRRAEGPGATRRGLVIDAALRELLPAEADSQPPELGARDASDLQVSRDARGPDASPTAARSPSAAPQPPATAPAPRASARAFRNDSFEWEGARWPFRLYVPSGIGDEPLPLVVLLHGCTQTATDFALGTAMNAQAELAKCYVLYPEQLQKANHSRCWNWFEPANQKRDTGEAGMIAALTRQTLGRRQVDPSRVYVAGLSAGGAMASILGALYPDLFAAVGVHSGLPCGAAWDIPSAFSAMRSGPPAAAPAGRLPPVATIVFHGTADRTVHPDNGERIAQAAVKAVQFHGRPLERRESTEEGAGARPALRTRYLADDGTPWVEHWEIDAGTHGWSGGDTAGSHTDPRGPSATAAMMAFFLQHRLPRTAGR